MRSVLNIAFFIFLMSLPGTANSGKYAASFLKIGVGPRYLAAGSVGVALGGEVASFYWNPAGLATINKVRTELMYATQFGGLGTNLGTMQYLGFALPLAGRATIALNYIRFGVDDIPVYPELEGRNIYQRLQNPAILPNGTPSAYIQDNENAFFISFAKNNEMLLDLGWRYFKIPVEIPFGMNFKVIQINLGDESASGLGIDLGAMIRLDVNDLLSTESLGKLGFGFAVKDLTKTSISWSTRHRDSIEASFNWGFSYEQNLRIWDSQIIIFGGRMDSGAGGKGVGLEWNLFHRFSLRAGNKDHSFSAGAGLSLASFRIDYAFASHDLGFSHRISASFDLNFLKSEK